MHEVDNIILKLPNFIYIVGKSDQGKTYFVYNELAKKALESGFQIHYVVNKGFDIEVPLAEQALKNKNVFIHPAADIGPESMAKLKTILSENEKKKMVIIDNFTYSLTLEFLDFVTFCRKYNATTVFISHSLYANQKISPRLRENVGYWIFFYSPRKNAYSKILDSPEALEALHHNIDAGSYKFMIFDPARDTYAIGKLPEYNLKLEVTDQKQTGKVAKALKAFSKTSGTNKLLDSAKKLPDSVNNVDKPPLDFFSVKPDFAAFLK